MQKENMSGMKILLWLPRIFGIVYGFFLALFAFDSSGIGFLIHLIPALLTVVIVIMAWKKPLIGSTGFLLFSFSYFFLVGLNRPFSWYLTISGPAVVISVLFWLSFKKGN